MPSWDDIEKLQKLHSSDRFLVIEETKSDLTELENWGKEIVSKLPPPGSSISPRMYLQIEAIHVLIVSRFDYMLSRLGKIKGQHQIPNYIRSTSLSDREKEHLILFFLRRHPPVHNAGHIDSKFIINVEKANFRTIAPKFAESKTSLTTMSIRDVSWYVNAIRKIIDQDLMKEFETPL